MATYHVKEHEITALRIVDVRPLIAGGQMVGPDQGLALHLSDGTKHRWISESAGSTPIAGSYLVRDLVLHMDFIVPAEVFAVLFSQE